MDIPEPPEQPEPEEGTGRRRLSEAQQVLIIFIVVLAIVNVVYRLVYAEGFQRTAALFVGVPAILAIALVLTSRSDRSAVAIALRGSMVALLIAGIVLPEGLICLAMAAPLVALVAVIVGLPIDWARSRGRRKGPTLMIIALPLLVLSSEGVVGTPFDGHDSVTASITVAAPPEAVADALGRPPAFHAEPPPFLRFGWNRPVGVTGSGIAVGDRRTIDFSGGTHDDHPLRLFGLTGERGVDHHAEMHLTVTESGTGRVVFSVDHDGTMLGRWVDINRAVITWSAASPAATRVTWTLEYERLVTPTAYFAPIARYGMDVTAGYLLDTVVTEQLP